MSKPLKLVVSKYNKGAVDVAQQLKALGIDEVLAIALESMPEPLSDEEFLAGTMGQSAEADDEEKNRINTH